MKGPSETMSVSKNKEKYKYQNALDRRYKRVKELTDDSDFAWLEQDCVDIDSMTDTEILKEYKHYKKANPNGIDWEEM